MPNLTEKWLIWCNLNDEQDALEKAFEGDCVSIRGTTPMHLREEMERSWREGEVPIMITKPAVFGFGMNWQHCARAAYVGLSDSFEQLDQSIHRIHRYGQTRECHIHVITSELEGAVVRNIERKRLDHQKMTDAMIAQMSDLNTQALHGGAERDTTVYEANMIMQLPEWVRSETV